MVLAGFNNIFGATGGYFVSILPSSFVRYAYITPFESGIIFKLLNCSNPASNLA